MATTRTKNPKKRGQTLARQDVTLVENRQLYVNTSSYEGAEQIDVDKPLTDKQRAFVKHWASGESINSAMIRAGFDENSITYGWRLARQPNVLALYHEEKRKYEEAAGMTRKKVMEGLIEAVEMAKLMAEPATMVAGWREIGKMCGYYEPVKKVIDVNINGQITQKVERLDDETLLAIIKGQAGGEVLDAVFREVQAVGHDEEVEA